jgi:deoxycytidylate deaminase
MNGRSISRDEAQQLTKRDLDDEDKDYGQRTRGTFYRADVFVELDGDRYKNELKRFLQLIFGFPYTTPTPDEFGMYLAYSASLRSAQLGRQVCAAILNQSGDRIAVGCNEVPTAGGGLFTLKWTRCFPVAVAASVPAMERSSRPHSRATTVRGTLLRRASGALSTSNPMRRAKLRRCMMTPFGWRTQW